MTTSHPTAPPPPPNLLDRTPSAARDLLAVWVAGRGLPGYRVGQMLRRLWQAPVGSWAEATELPLALRAELDTAFPLPRLTSDVEQVSADGTRKYLWRLPDGEAIESVLIPSGSRRTLCISSQAGCALKCSFCATGLMGLKRNLRAEEIVAQVVAMGEFHGWRDDRFNIVFMGMGEPLANLAPVTESIRVLHDDHGLNLGARRVTVSTSGLVPQIRELAKLDLQVGLAVSLHATTDELRDELVPVNKRWPIRELLDAAKEYGHTVGRRVTLEYVLLGGVNDTPEDADRLAEFARQLPSKVNLIPYNPVPGLSWQRPSPAAVQAFAERLYPHAPAVTVRQTQGGEIWAACGQLGGLTPE